MGDKAQFEDNKQQQLKVIDDPLEEYFNIESRSTEKLVTEIDAQPLVVDKEYDDKDNEIENQFDEVRALALSAFDDQNDGEIAAQYLKLALEAIHQKSSTKMHKDKLAISKQQANNSTINQNIIVDRNDLLKTLLAEKSESDMD